MSAVESRVAVVVGGGASVNVIVGCESAFSPEVCCFRFRAKQLPADPVGLMRLGVKRDRHSRVVK